jgi:hypothetical protein
LRAFDTLWKTMQGEKVAAVAPLQPHLVIRSSTAPPLVNQKRR